MSNYEVLTLIGTFAMVLLALLSFIVKIIEIMTKK
ncbi:putative holin-like toxin [uncultured Granulicatella sp.]